MSSSYKMRGSRKALRASLLDFLGLSMRAPSITTEKGKASRRSNETDRDRKQASNVKAVGVHC